MSNKTNNNKNDLPSLTTSEEQVTHERKQVIKKFSNLAFALKEINYVTDFRNGTAGLGYYYKNLAAMLTEVMKGEFSEYGCDFIYMTEKVKKLAEAIREDARVGGQ